MNPSFKNVVIPMELLNDRLGAKIASLFTGKKFEDLAAVDAFCGRTKGIGPKTQKNFHLLIVEVMKVHNQGQAKTEPKKEEKVTKPEYENVRLPKIMKTIGWVQAKDPKNQELFEKLVSAMVREETDNLVRFRIEATVYRQFATAAYKMMGHIKKQMVKRGYSTEFGGGWLIIYKK